MAKRTPKKSTGTAPEEDIEPVPEPDTQDRIEKMKAVLSEKNRTIESLTRQRDALAATNAKLEKAMESPAASSDPNIEIYSADGVAHEMPLSEILNWWDTYVQPGQGLHTRNIVAMKKIG